MNDEYPFTNPEPLEFKFKTEFTIGRNTVNDWIINLPEISGFHCTIGFD